MQAPVPISLLLMISTLLKSPNRSPKKRGKATIVRLTKYSPTIIIKAQENVKAARHISQHFAQKYALTFYAV